MNELIKTIFIFASIKLSESLTIECSYTNHTYSHLEKVQCCHVINNLNILSQEKAVITTTNKNDSLRTSTVGFRIFNITTRYFPQDLVKIFTNLKVIEVSHAQLMEIHQTDLKSFTLLEVLYFDSNDIEILENRLFEYNRNLSYILFSKNKLVHIDENVFNSLGLLKNLYLNRNECIDKGSTNNSQEVLLIIKTIKEQCQNTDFTNLNQNLTTLENSTKNLNIEDIPEFYKNLRDLESSRFSQYSTIKKRFKSLKDESLSYLWSNIMKLNNQITETNKTVIQELKKLENKQNSINSTISEVLLQPMKNTTVDEQEPKIEESPILEQLRFNLSNIADAQSKQASKVKDTHFSWEPFWIGVCSVLVLILMIVLLKNYVSTDRLISYSISDSTHYNHEGKRVSYL